MPWYKIESLFTQEIYLRNVGIMETGKARSEESGKQRGFAICTSMKLSDDKLSAHTALYFSPVAALLCFDILESLGGELCPSPPSAKESGFTCCGDLENVQGLLK